MNIILGKGMLHWMRTGNHIEIWELEDTKYRQDLEEAIRAQNDIGWQNMMKGRLATEWGDIQMKHYTERCAFTYFSYLVG